MVDGWTAKVIQLKFLLGELCVFSVSLPAWELKTHFSRLINRPPEPLPFREFPVGVEVAVIRSQPIETPLSRIALVPGAIRYVPSQYSRFTVDLQGSYADYLKKFSARSRSTLSRKVRRFADFSGGEILWRTFRTAEELATFRRLAREISSKSWQKRLFQGGLPDDEDFWRHVKDLAMQGAARGYILFHAKRPIAYLFCPAQETFLLYEYLGYDWEFHRWSPGTVLLCLVLESLYNERVFCGFDFCEGESPYKRFFSTHSTMCADIYYFRGTARNLLLLGAHSGLYFFSRATVKVLDWLGLKGWTKRCFRFASFRMRFAWATLSRMIRNPLLDLRYGAILRGTQPSRYAHLGANLTVNTDYSVLPPLFKNRVKESDVLVDVGCGKGRVINWWLSRGFRNKIIGIELDEEIAERTRRRLRKYQNVTIITGDVLENIPTEGTIFYLYDPFCATVMRKFKDRLIKLFEQRGNVLVVYYNPVCIDVFANDPRWIVEDAGLHRPGAHQAAIIRMREGS